MVPAGRGDRALAAALVGVGIPWLIYTRLYFFLQPRHLTFDTCAWMHMTWPDPTCGLTRTFAWMWRGDVVHAVAVYPLGPLVFLATIALILYGLGVLVTGRALKVYIPTRTGFPLLAVGIILLGMNWIAKLVWLGM